MTDDASGELELVWRGKYDGDGNRVRVPPRSVALTPIERHGSPAEPHGELVWGDNLDALDAWLPQHRGGVDLVYIDPPFSTGSDFPVLIRARDQAGLVRAVAQPAYTDRWPGGAAAYLAMLAPRLERIHALLTPHGSLYVHVDPTLGHAVRLLLDEVFGAAAFQREIIWRIGWVSGFKTRARNWIRNHDTILFYAKDPKRMRFNKVYVPHLEGYVRRSGAPAKAPGMAVDDVWNAGSGDLALRGTDALDSIQIKSFSREKTGYATQKNESLLRRIIAASSNPGDLVVDAFSGAGTTAVVAAAMGRRFLACDVGAAAIQLTRARLLGTVPHCAWTLATTRTIGMPDPAPSPAQVEKTGTRRWRISTRGRSDTESLTSTFGHVANAPSLVLELDIGSDLHATIAVVDVDTASRAPLGSEVRNALSAGVDPVLECAVDWAVSDDVLRPSEVRLADAERAAARSFSSPGPLDANTRVAIAVVDLTFARVRVDLEIERGRTWRVRASSR